MSFHILGLDPAPFRQFFGLTDDELSRRNVIRYAVDGDSGFPDRIELRDALPGETVLLLNYEHQAAATPYRSCHAIFVREGAERVFDARDRVPDALRRRVISLRAFGADHMLLDADIADGAALEPVIDRLLAEPRVAYLQAHYAKQGCYAARIERG